MLAVYYDESTPCLIRPTPLISITQNVIRNKAGMLGSYYDITLNGTILPDEGSPFYVAGGGSTAHILPATVSAAFHQNYQRPPNEPVHFDNAMSSIIHKQNMLRELFKRDGQLCELLPVSNRPESDSAMTDTPILKFHPTVQSISFEEGAYITNCKYTINLRAEVLLDNGNKIISDGITNSTISPTGSDRRPIRSNDRNLTLVQALNASGFIEDYSESWSLEVEEGNGTTNTNVANPTSLPANHIGSIRTYRVTRNITATGRTMYYTENGTGQIKRREAWEQAKQYIYNTVLKDNDNISTNNSTGYEQFPEYSLGPYFGSGFLNIAKAIWGGYNHLRTESIDTTAGTITVNDTWLMSSGNAYENFNMGVSKSYDSALHKVTVNGSIKGLSSVHAGSTQYGGSNTSIQTQFGNAPLNTSHENALYKWNQISNNGTYGPNCYLYRRAQSVVHLPLNFIPLSVSLSSNQFTGEITYDIEYDTRLQNVVNGALSENITCNDTYPGDVFAVIPVIGRQHGPVLQYIGGRTEYQRNLSIELVMDKYYTSGNGNLVDRIRQQSVLSKPSLNEPFKTQINSIIHAYSPIKEAGIRKYFVSPPSESWDPSTGRYSLQINWTYEVGR
jgi:hypothetical protein